MFWKKEKAKPEPRKVFVPEDKKRQLLAALDEYGAAPRDADHLPRYDFWKLAEEVCPEVSSGKWKTEFRNGINPYFVELLD